MKKDEIIPLSHNVLADLTVEELEQRLEMQMIAVPNADWCIIDNSCGTNSCGTDCTANGIGGGGDGGGGGGGDIQPTPV